ncbi:uncharacterized protein DNG_06997 [Cephalotrichum gorgonifer]|uniref:Zn(2)-C6 fungal-type domain-containing protein n=1 Tax=Cephalotrichum gorgonifer TaxID=2041049 RepID=A0AAE8N2L8_9PEZI|nr:uncharacterized protein DNG_06997 [Cephalotrichum gorgonifer]
MSLTTFERANPPPRRRSCVACTKAKRRCDFAYPSCLRCAGRGIECSYPHPHPHSHSRPHLQQRSRAPAAQRPATTSLPAPSPSLPVTSAPLPESALSMPPKTLDFSMEALMDGFWDTDACAVDPLPLHIPDLDAPALTANMSPGAGSSGSSGTPGSTSSFDINGLLRSAKEKQLVPVVGIQTCSSMDEALANFPQFVAERLSYLFDYLPKTPRVLVDTLGTPWCHPIVFRETTPKVFDELLSSCALFSAMTPSNKPIIMRIISSRLRDLINSPAPATPHAALARTHALCMYHIMALLDGDIESRASAEVTLPTLKTAASDLASHLGAQEDTIYPTELPLFPLTDTESFWKRWVLEESIRRTILSTLQFVACYQLIRSRSPLDCADTGLAQSWTLSAPLWGAGNAVDFAVAWGTKNRWLVTYHNNAQVWECAEADDVCQFGRLLMTCCLGYQQTRGWFAMKGKAF